MRKRYIVTGAIGCLVAALCCFTPALSIAIGLMGLGIATVYFDYVLIPVMFLFVALAIYGLFSFHRGRSN